MLNCQVIGVGAAGNKAAIKLVENKIVGMEDILLVNSTLRDVPEEFVTSGGRIVEIGTVDSLGGCGKEPEVGKKLCIEAMQNGKLNLDTFVRPDAKMVIVVSSTEGGTGCGASPVIADYLRSVMGVDVVVFGFTGFEEDARGLLNTINWFKNLPNDIVVEAIRNKTFLTANKGNYLKAEEDANLAFATKVSIRIGNCIHPSEQNMDETDLYKTSTQPGYSIVEYKEISENIKNVAHFSSILKEMIDESSALRPDSQSEKILGIIVNVPERSRDNIDYSFAEIIDRYGKPFEKFTHIQSVEGMPYFVAFISSGMDLPLDEVKDVYDKYIEATSRVKKDKDNFFAQLSGIGAAEEDSIFNVANKAAKTKGKNSFFNSYNAETPNRPEVKKEAASKKDEKMNNY